MASGPVALASTLLLAAGAPLVVVPVASAANATTVRLAPELPRDAAEVAERLASCIHFSGELNGDGSARDAEVDATMTELRCDVIEHDAAATRRRYAGNADVIAALDEAAEP